MVIFKFTCKSNTVWKQTNEKKNQTPKYREVVIAREKAGRGMGEVGERNFFFFFF